MASWAAQELQYADLGDMRRNKRLIRLVRDLAAQPNVSIPQASGDWAATQAAYDFWSCPHVKPEAIRVAHQTSTIERAKQHSVVIAAQDTTEVNFTHHPSKRGMGYLDNASSRGLKIHSVLCSSANGVPLGVLHQQVWSRDPAELGKKHQRHKKLIQDKESQRWLTALEVTQNRIPEEIVVVTVADREADIYELFVLPRRPNSELLIRSHHNRCVKSTSEDQQQERLEQAMRQVPAWGQLSLELRRHPEREPRVATLTLHATTLELQPPATHLWRHCLQPISLQVIWAQEENPPLGAKPISWLLLTTLAINCFEDVVQCLRWYSYRWLIERYHYVLKSGCRLEQLQLETAERIQRALATYTIVAWRLLWITYLARKGDGEPGVKTIWQGLRRLHDIAQTWLLLSPTTPTCVKSDFVKKDVSKA